MELGSLISYTILLALLIKLFSNSNNNLVVAKINVKLKKQTQIKARKERHKTNTERRVETNGRKRHKVKRAERKKKILIGVLAELPRLLLPRVVGLSRATIGSAKLKARHENLLYPSPSLYHSVSPCKLHRRSFSVATN